ncbi:MAG: hypothetical protein KAJ13_06005 [Gemmatimonadetes bacterium]|nr:hypothetical protein [Gemmatimonadota bacterium]
MRRILTAVGLIAVTLVSVSCSRKAVVESGPAAGTAEATARGTVRRLGSEAAVRTVIQGDESVIVVGDYESEIARAAGAEVWVSGTPVSSEYGPALRVSEYRILSVDGDVPVVGILAEDASGFFIRKDDGSAVRLDVNDRLAGQLGAKIWVVLGADRVTVSRYGILRD